VQWARLGRFVRAGGLLVRAVRGARAELGALTIATDPADSAAAAEFALPADGGFLGKLPEECTVLSFTNPTIWDQEGFEGDNAGVRFVSSAHGLSILDASSAEVPVAGLSDAVKIKIPLLANTTSFGSSGEVAVCRYWDSSAGTWSREGCAVAAQTASAITCECTHLTEFAITSEPKADGMDGNAGGSGSEGSAPVAAIVGGVIGGLLVVGGLAAMLVMRQRKGQIGGLAATPRKMSKEEVDGKFSVDVDVATTSNPALQTQFSDEI
jgi:hypothetical protein